MKKALALAILASALGLYIYSRSRRTKSVPSQIPNSEQELRSVQESELKANDQSSVDILASERNATPAESHSPQMDTSEHAKTDENKTIVQAASQTSPEGVLLSAVDAVCAMSLDHDLNELAALYFKHLELAQHVYFLLQREGSRSEHLTEAGEHLRSRLEEIIARIISRHGPGVLTSLGLPTPRQLEQEQEYQREKLAHEIILGGASKNGSMLSVGSASPARAPTDPTKKVEDLYWNWFQSELQKTPPNYKVALDMLIEIKGEISSLTPNRQDLQHSLNEYLDEQLLHQMLEHDALDYETFGRLVSYVCQRILDLEAPARNDETRQWLSEVGKRLQAHEKVDTLLPEALKFLYGRLKLIHADAARSGIVFTASKLQGELGVRYEREKFQQHLTAKHISLHNTSAWLTESLTTLCKENRPLYMIVQDPNQDTNALAVYVTGILGLLQKDVALSMRNGLPETLRLDQDRLVRHQNDLQLITILGAGERCLMESLKTSKVSLTEEQFRTHIKPQLAAAVLQPNASLTAIADMMVQAITNVMAEDMSPQLDALIRSVLQQQVLNPQSPIYQVSRSRICTTVGRLLYHHLSLVFPQLTLSTSTSPGVSPARTPLLSPVRSPHFGPATPPIRRIHLTETHGTENVDENGAEVNASADRELTSQESGDGSENVQHISMFPLSPVRASTTAASTNSSQSQNHVSAEEWCVEPLVKARLMGVKPDLLRMCEAMVSMLKLNLTVHSTYYAALVRRAAFLNTPAVAASDSSMAAHTAKSPSA
eukprot:TRINITY_DN11579_c0_g1::TRINITY_DN11579_c0_g1_i1::g.22112::m.22112 TRINITY_DN11579_c0_g1::TRINITY_DN11579_c0_g1_i1::g.22112  ORF type:complete len:772 (+),score=116.62,sp/Q9NUJ3/T11L1_HUMAN/28.43/3e-15,Tcp11/PF05794.8/2.3e-48,Peptidase_C70/PF12385.3/72,Peptidase_C70/PF12385.3/1.1 TRINITY_DN11579_c0_g1_i1:45-2360(+)